MPGPWLGQAVAQQWSWGGGEEGSIGASPSAVSRQSGAPGQVRPRSEIVARGRAVIAASAGSTGGVAGGGGNGLTGSRLAGGGPQRERSRSPLPSQAPEPTWEEWLDQLHGSGPLRPMPEVARRKFGLTGASRWLAFTPIDFALVEGTLAEQAEDLFTKMGRLLTPQEIAEARADFEQCGCRSCQRNWLAVFQGWLAAWNHTLPGPKLDLPPDPPRAYYSDAQHRKWIKLMCDRAPMKERPWYGHNSTLPNSTAPAGQPRGGNQ